nr:MAG TPA: hypothetical protein [Bacteriophage sp.]
MTTNPRYSSMPGISILRGGGRLFSRPFYKSAYNCLY